MLSAREDTEQHRRERWQRESSHESHRPRARVKSGGTHTLAYEISRRHPPPNLTPACLTYPASIHPSVELFSTGGAARHLPATS